MDRTAKDISPPFFKMLAYKMIVLMAPTWHVTPKNPKEMVPAALYLTGQIESIKNHFMTMIYRWILA